MRKAMENLIKNTIEKLKKDNLKPTSRRMFLLRKIFTWFLVFAVSVFSAVALATVIFLIFQFDWDVSRKFGGPLFFGFIYFPYLWTALAGLFAFAAYAAIRHTKSGYKYDWKKVTIIMAGLIMGLGIFAYSTDLGRKADFVARKNMPMYGDFVRDMKDQWMRPEDGFLAGEIISANEKEIVLADFEGEEWKILIDENVLIKPRVVIAKGEGIKLIGEKIEKNKFKVSEIRPWMGNMMQRKFNSDDFRGRYHMKGRVRGETDSRPGFGRGMMDWDRRER